MSSEEVHDRLSFVIFVRWLRSELNDPDQRKEWENTDLSSVLEAMAAWATDWTSQPNDNPWRHAAQIIEAATIYE